LNSVPAGSSLRICDNAAIREGAMHWYFCQLWGGMHQSEDSPRLEEASFCSAGRSACIAFPALENELEDLYEV
jgi:hypothetical protein